jgi:pimeloyl-ACP methyl ester carboxylesterase
MALHLSPIVEGHESGGTILFIQGWPDDASLWDEAVGALRDRYRCVRVTLPNFGGDRSVRWGFSTEEILEALAELLCAISEGQKVSLVLHDWGCYWGHALHNRYPELVSRVASLDIAPHHVPRGRDALWRRGRGAAHRSLGHPPPLVRTPAEPLAHRHGSENRRGHQPRRHLMAAASFRAADA